MYLHVDNLINEIAVDEPDPAAANALQEGLGGQFGEMRTMMQYLFQAMNFRGPAAKPYRDLIQGIGTEEISHVELIGTTIARLLDGAPGYSGKPTDPQDKPGAKGAAPLVSALAAGNIHHFLVAGQGARAVDSVGNPWTGAYVYNSGTLVLDLLYNLMLESTARQQKCRIYEMTENKAARSTLAYLIVRDQSHENAYAKALESLGVDWGKTLPIPKTERREVAGGQGAARPRAAPQDVHLQRGQPHRGREDLPGHVAVQRRHDPDRGRANAAVGVPNEIAVERPEEFSPGLDKELLAMLQATAELELSDVVMSYGPIEPSLNLSRALRLPT